MNSTHRCLLSLTDKAKDFILENSYDEDYGARPIKRYVTKNIETLLAEEIVKDRIKVNDSIIIELEQGVLKIKKGN